jgi:hypothetical protein
MLSNILPLLALVASTVVAAPASKSSLVVDLGYSKYQGTNLGNGVSQWLGIRYAAPPLGDLRFRAPRDPIVNHTLQVANKVCVNCYIFYAIFMWTELLSRWL